MLKLVDAMNVETLFLEKTLLQSSGGQCFKKLVDINGFMKVGV